MDGSTERVPVTVYVDGQKTDIMVEESETAESLLQRVVSEQGLIRPAKDYVLRWYENGTALNLQESLRANGVTPGSILALVPVAGIGG